MDDLIKQGIVDSTLLKKANVQGDKVAQEEIISRIAKTSLSEETRRVIADIDNIS